MSKKLDIFPNMQFIETILGELKISVRELGRKIKTSGQNVSNWRLHSSKQKEFLTAMCRLRALSGRSWSEFGKMLDEEFLKDK